MGHYLTAPQTKAAIGGIPFLMRGAEAAEIALYIISAGKAMAVVLAGKAVVGQGERDVCCLGIDGVHQQLNDALPMEPA